MLKTLLILNEPICLFVMSMFCFRMLDFVTESVSKVREHFVETLFCITDFNKLRSTRKSSVCPLL